MTKFVHSINTTIDLMGNVAEIKGLGGGATNGSAGITGIANASLIVIVSGIFLPRKVSSQWYHFLMYSPASRLQLVRLQFSIFVPHLKAKSEFKFRNA